jgi:hypothetical protein
MRSGIAGFIWRNPYEVEAMVSLGIQGSEFRKENFEIGENVSFGLIQRN